MSSRKKSSAEDFLILEELGAAARRASADEQVPAPRRGELLLALAEGKLKGGNRSSAEERWSLDELGVCLSAM